MPLLDDYRHGRAIGRRREALPGSPDAGSGSAPCAGSAHPRLELEKTKGFREVIIGPEVEATCLVHVRVASGQQHDRHFARAADPAEDLPP